MNQFTILSALVALGTATRQGAPLNTAIVQPWLDQHLPNLVTKAQALRDGATWTEVGALIEAAVQAAQELKPVLAGTARAAFVLAVVQSLVREFAPPSAQWLLMLLNSPFAALLIEMAFRRLFPGG
ncbi:hypothetical protein [Deinococcus radiotolerans]|uniref:Uncharacterized protein n=1 Tax=Deinococcus radiotolerans TaxID=1309407 RepID=A0ABQ2FQW9_9DEIO|nr:hypothetical protein [Deinococcus radiotolerans]GGL18169.1 hypothetical protein GCM10010844_41250 [Deinococcus radiotolerans]